MLDKAFGHPQGILGRIGGALMARGNAATELKVVDIAAPADTDTVLVVGPGPGVGLRAAAERARLTIGVDPSEDMLRACVERCADLVKAEKVRVRVGTAEETGVADGVADLVISVNNVQIWDDRPEAWRELLRTLRPGGRLVLSSHEKWLPGTRHELAAEVEAAGFTDVQSWTWDPPGRMASRACQLSAIRP